MEEWMEFDLKRAGEIIRAAERGEPIELSDEFEAMLYEGARHAERINREIDHTPMSRLDREAMAIYLTMLIPSPYVALVGTLIAIGAKMGYNFGREFSPPDPMEFSLS